MNHNMTLFLCGLIPVLTGFVMDRLITVLNLTFILPFLSIAFLCLWGYLAYRVSSPKEGAFVQACKINTAGLVCLCAILLQHFLLNRYLPNLIGIVPQMYFLPCLNVTYLLTQWLLHLIVPVLGLPPVYCLEFVLMFLSSLIGFVRAR